MLVFLPSFCAEGTPVLVLEMVKRWLKQNIHPTIVALNSHPTDLLPEFRSLDIPVHFIEIGARGYSRYINLTRETYNLCCEHRPDAVLSMVFGWHSFIGWGARLAGIRTVAAHVGNYPPHWTGTAFQKFRAFVQLGRPVTHRLICCSHYVESGVIQWFRVSQRETITIYNGCTLNQFDRGARPHPSEKPERSFTIGMVARLEQHKDHPTLIRAACLLKAQGINFQVLLIGEGSRRSEYEALIEAENVADCVQLLGMRRDISDLLQKLDAFVFSAKPDEGLGVALVEAMAAGVPIVATDVGACREVLLDGHCGLLVKPNHPQSLAGGILEVLGKPDEANTRANDAHNHVFQNFSIESMAEAYAKELDLNPKSTRSL